MRSFHALLLTCALVLTGCPDTPAPPDVSQPPASPTAPGAPVPPKAAPAPDTPAVPDTPTAPDPVAKMAKDIKDKLGFEVCTRYADDTCQDPAETFAADVAVIHAVLNTIQVPRETGSYEIKWICEDSGGVAPLNYVIETTKGGMAELLRKVSTHVTIHGQLSKPTKGWPKGQYRVEVSLDGKLADTTHFKIQ